ncbi:MAG: arsenate reductase (azurin) small subunit [Nitrospira sp.]|nr:arsenate reductase (azurin) small subunit [Nitrospira sp.]
MMSDVSRRHFLQLGACVVGGACAADALPSLAHAAEGGDITTLRTTLPYPRVKLASIGQLTVGREQLTTYPDQASPVVLAKLGRPAINGVGQDRDIVAFSRRCSHMGGTLSFRPDTATFHCPLHYAFFDAQKGGLLVIGQATDNLPQLELEVDAAGDIFAVGIRGLLYGRQTNVLA